MRNMMICEPIWFSIRKNESIGIWNDPCREYEILAYMVTSLISMKVELVPRCPSMRNMKFEAI